MEAIMKSMQHNPEWRKTLIETNPNLADIFEEYMEKKIRKPSDRCEECGNDAMIIVDCQKLCKSCGVVDPNYQEVAFVGNYTATPKYKPSDHFETVLYRLQGRWSNACARFDANYLAKLKAEFSADDFSLSAIHRRLPNKDQRHLNYIYYRLSDKKLDIEWHHADHLKRCFCRCYKEYHNLDRKRPCALNIIEVVVDCFPALSYIKPFIYTKCKLHKDIYNRVKNVCTTE